MPSSRTGFIWIYVLIVLFAVGIIEMVMMPAVEYQLVPSLQMTANMTLSPADAAGFASHVADTVRFMHGAMYMVMFVLFVYAVVSVFKREETEMYQP